jgi:uncharacterized membrane protein (UPF0127 family)
LEGQYDSGHTFSGRFEMRVMDLNRFQRSGRRHAGGVAVFVLVWLLHLTFPNWLACGASAAGSNRASTAGAPGRFDTTPEFDRMRNCTVWLITDVGKPLTIDVKLADEPKLQAAGFQRIGEAVIEKSFILFVYDHEEIRQFHMRNVRAPLDIAFFDSEGTMQGVLLMKPDAAMPAPFLNLYKPIKPFQYALEARAGFFQDQGLSAGRGRLQVGSLCQ